MEVKTDTVEDEFPFQRGDLNIFHVHFFLRGCSTFCWEYVSKHRPDLFFSASPNTHTKKTVPDDAPDFFDKTHFFRWFAGKKQGFNQHMK